MTPEALAELHARCFAAAPRPWSATEFAALTAASATILVTDAAAGFALGRVAGPEAELLTLAVEPETRRRGIGRRLIAGFESAAACRDAREIFLEVAATNAAARALYAGEGYEEIATRPDYYSAPGLAPISAIVLRKAILRDVANA
jgi:ribosomal-protein-alanine N-acetyltransferase